MTRQEYLSILEQELGSLSFADVKDITSEINEHFDMGVASGKTEEEVAEGLGDPKVLAKEYMDGGNLKTAKTRAEAKAPNKNSVITPPKPVRTKDPAAGKVVVITFNILIGIPFFVLLAIIIAAFCGVLASLIFALVEFCMAIPSFGVFVTSGIMFAITSVFLLIALICLLYFAIKYFFVGLAYYIKLNKSIWTEGI